MFYFLVAYGESLEFSVLETISKSPDFQATKSRLYESALYRNFDYMLLIKQLQLRSQPEDLFGLQLLRKSLSDLQPEYDDQCR
jgi:hypothetical protein